MFARAAVLTLCASLAAADTFAVLVCGSNGFDNYRHHADIAHAYQILTRGGVKAENIITMMYDDVPYDVLNLAHYGKLYNKPAGIMEEANEVYASVKDHIDYKGDDVTPGNFAAVLTGDEAAAGGKKVLKSTAGDDVFVYFADHGGVGLIGFPKGQTMAEESFSGALNAMYEKKMYRQLVFYMEACESGSMWENVPADRNVYALSAASANESSYATYCNNPRVGLFPIPTCLGDEFSVKWMENADGVALAAETLQAQYELVKRETIDSHVLQWGNVSMAAEAAGRFEGKGQTAPQKAQGMPAAGRHGTVSSRDVGLATAFNVYMAAAPTDRPARAAALIAEIEHREAADATFAALAARLALPAVRDTATATPHRACHAPAHQAVAAHCGGYTDYSLQYAGVVVGACNHRRGDTAAVVEAIAAVCAGR